MTAAFSENLTSNVCASSIAILPMTGGGAEKTCNQPLDHDDEVAQEEQKHDARHHSTRTNAEQ